MILGGGDEAWTLAHLNEDGDQTLFAIGATGNLAAGDSDKVGVLFVKASAWADNHNTAVLNGERGDLILGDEGTPATASIRTDNRNETVNGRA